MESPLSASSTQCGLSDHDMPKPQPDPDGQHARRTGCHDAAEPAPNELQFSSRRPEAIKVLGLMAQQEAVFERLLARNCADDGSPAQDKSSVCLRFAESLRACKAAVDDVFGTTSASAEWNCQVAPRDGGAESAGARLAQRAQGRVLQEAHPACSRLKMRVLVRSWRSLVLRRQDRQSVLHYAETLYNLNLTCRAMHAFVGFANTPCTEHVACQTTPPKPQSSPVAALQSIAPDPLSDVPPATVNSKRGHPGSSPNAKAKIAIKKNIRLMRTILPDTPGMATTSALRIEKVAHVRGAIPRDVMKVGPAADHEKTAEGVPSSRVSTMPPVPRLRGKAQNNDREDSARRGDKGPMARRAGRVWASQPEKPQVAEDVVKRDQRRQEREKLLCKVEMMEAKLLREISALDAQRARRLSPPSNFAEGGNRFKAAAGAQAGGSAGHSAGGAERSFCHDRTEALEHRCAEEMEEEKDGILLDHNVMNRVDSTRNRRDETYQDASAQDHALHSHDFQPESRASLRGSGEGRLAEDARGAAGGRISVECCSKLPPTEAQCVLSSEQVGTPATSGGDSVDSGGIAAGHAGEAAKGRREKDVAEMHAEESHLSQGEGWASDIEDQENRSPQKTHRDRAVTQKRPTVVSKETSESNPLLQTARKSGLDAAVEPCGKHQLPPTQVQPQENEHQRQQDAVNVKKGGHLHESKNVVSAHSVLRSSLKKDAGMGLGCEEQLEVGWIEVGIQRATTDEERRDANETDMHETDMQSHAASRCEAGQQLLPPNKSVAHGEEEWQDQIEAEPQPRRRSPVPTNFGERPPLGVAKIGGLGSTALYEDNGRKGPEGDRSSDDSQRCPQACAPEPRSQPTSAHGTPASPLAHPSYSALAARASSVARVKPPRPRTPGAAHLHRTPNHNPDNTPENPRHTHAACLPHDPAPSALCCGSSDAMRCSLEKSAHKHVVAYAAMPALDRSAVGEGGERPLQKVCSSATMVSQCPQQSAAPPRPKISQRDRRFNGGVGPAARDIAVEGMRHHTKLGSLLPSCACPQLYGAQPPPHTWPNGNGYGTYVTSTGMPYAGTAYHGSDASIGRETCLDRLSDTAWGWKVGPRADAQGEPAAVPRYPEGMDKTVACLIGDGQVRSSGEWKMQDVHGNAPRPSYRLGQSSMGRTNRCGPSEMPSQTFGMASRAARADGEGRNRAAGLNRKDGARVSWEDEQRGAGKLAQAKDAGLLRGARHARDEDDAPLSDSDDACHFHSNDDDDSLETEAVMGGGCARRNERVSSENPFAKYLRGSSSDVVSESEDEHGVDQDARVSEMSDQKEVRMSWREREQELMGLADVANSALLAREQPYNDIELPWIKAYRIAIQGRAGRRNAASGERGYGAAGDVTFEDVQRFWQVRGW